MSQPDMTPVSVRLMLEPESSFTQVEVVDDRLEPVEGGRGIGLIEVDVPPGLYQVTFSAGSQRDTQIIKVNAGESTRRVTQTQALEIASAAPVYRSRTSREIQGALAQEDSLSQPQLLPEMGTGGAHLLIFVRELFMERGGDNPAEGLTLHQVGSDGLERRVFNVGTGGQYRPAEGTTSIHLNVDPGAYFLQVRTADGRRLRQMIYLAKDWQTQVFLVTIQDRQRRRADFSSMAVLMVRPGTGFDPGSDDLAQATRALDALSRGVGIGDRDLDRLINAKFENPMLGLYGFHLYLQGRQIQHDWCTILFDNLSGLLDRHPDVLAAGWGALLSVAEKGYDQGAFRRIKDGLFAAGPVSQPPMLAAGWRYLSRASYGAPWVVPHGSLLEQISDVVIGSEPWLFWEADEQRQSVREQKTPGTLSPLESSAISPYAQYESVKIEDLDAVEMSAGPDILSVAQGDIMGDIEAKLQAMSQHIAADPLKVNERLLGGEISGTDAATLVTAFPYLQGGARRADRERIYSSRGIEPWQPLPAADLVGRLKYPAITVLSMLSGLERWLAQG